jgi:hypothetical protein
VNLYAFIASIVSSLAWPILIAGLVFLAMGRSKTLEGTIETIREYVESIKMGGAEIKLRAARRDAETVAAEQGKVLGDQAPPPTEEFLRRAEEAPALVVFELWKTLEEATLRFQRENRLRLSTVSGFMRMLRDYHRLTASEFRLFELLRSIRNEVAHSRNPHPITVAEVVEYRTFVATLIARLEQLKVEDSAGLIQKT